MARPRPMMPFTSSNPSRSSTVLPLLLDLKAGSYRTMVARNTKKQRRAWRNVVLIFLSKVPDALINLLVFRQHEYKPIEPILAELKTSFPNQAFFQGLERVEGAFEQEVIKHKVSA